MRNIIILRKSVFRLSLCGILLFLMLPLWSAYLTNKPVTVRQPDGTEIKCFASGDEYHNWLHDADKYTIIQSPTTGYYVYAVKSGATVVAGNVVVGTVNPRSAGLAPNINISNEEYKRLRRTKFQAPAQRDAPTTGTVNNLVVYIRFSDQTEFGQSNTIYDGWFNTSTISQKNYFLEASYNQLTVNTTFYPAPVSGNVVSWQDSHPRGYYSPYSASNAIGYSSDTQSTDRLFTLLQNASNGVATAVPAGLTIDGDGDGNVDNVVFIVKGASDSWNDLLWPHRWSIYDRTVTIRSKRVYDYNFQLSEFLATDNVGVLCHEFFHTLGSPDLYHYNESVFTPVGSWDLMEATANPPQHMGAYMKWKYGHWISSITTLTTNGTYTLNPMTSSTGNCYRINSPNSTAEYFMVEYRRKTGTYENSIPASGILVYRINTGVGEGNADGPPDEVYIYRPGGTTSADGTISSAYFSSGSGRTSINDTTNPSSFLTSGAAGGLSLSSIGASGGTTMSFTKGTTTPANITWTPASFTQALAPTQTASQNLVIGNTGNQTLTYTCSLPTGSSIVLDETFASTTIPTGWTQVNDTGSTAWVFATGGGYSNTHPSTAYDGTYNARLYIESYTPVVTKLVTPSMNLSGATSATLTFWHTQEVWPSDQDELRVYYKTSAGGTWTLLTTYTNSITAWTMETISLPNPNGTYYIGFQGTAKYGYGVCLDKVVVTKVAGSTPTWFTLNSGTTVTGSIANGGANNTITVGFNTTGMAAGTYNSNITVASNSATNSTVTIPVTLTVRIPITLSAPTTGAVWQGGTSQTISWVYTGSGSTVGLYFSTNGGTAWTLIGNPTTVSGTNNYSWTIPYVSSTNCKVKVVDSVSPAFEVIGNIFTITTSVIAVNQTSLAYGTVLINATSSNTFTITNSGTAALSGTITTPTGYTVSLARVPFSRPQSVIKSVQNNIQDSNSAELRNSLAYTVAIGATNTYNLVFAPTAVQAYNGTVTITHNASGASKTIAITGQGGKPTIGKSATAFTANLAPGQTNSQTLTLSNSGNMALNYGLTISGTPAWLTINSGTTVSNTIAVSGAAQNITITCNSAGMSPGTYNGTINGTSNDPSSLTYSVTVTLTVRNPVVITAPASGASWQAGTTQTISWGYTGAGSSVTLYYSTDGGTGWTSVGSIATTQGVNNYSWTVPSTASTNCKIKLVDSISPNYAAISNVFTITNPTPPSTPSNVTISRNTSTGNVTISWSASTGSPTGYKIYRGTTPDFTIQESALVGTKTAAETSIIIPAASVGIQAFYKVIAYRN